MVVDCCNCTEQPCGSNNLAMALFGSRYNCSVLGIITILTTNYGVKQSQFTKPTLEPRASDPEESNEVFDRVIRGWLL